MFTFEKDRQTIAGIGSVLVDILVHETDAFLEKTKAAKGGMTYVDMPFIDRLISMASQEPVFVPGGSACNTIIGAGKLGGPARFVGKSGSGSMAALFESHLKLSSVEPFLLKSNEKTGRVLSIITPDAQRSMFTCLGASSKIQPDEIIPKHFEGAGIVHVEGYLLFNKNLIIAALNAAKKAGARISLDLASFTVVEEAKDFLEEIVAEFVDILIANEDEARAFTGLSDESEAIKALGKKSQVAVLKVGARGSYVSWDKEIIRIEPKGDGKALDTTGAGDLWASGFLFGMIRGYSPQKCGELGSLCGYEVCQVIGANIHEEAWQRIRASLEYGI